MSVEITVNDKFFDPNNCSDYERLRVREYILKEFIGMAHQPQPPEKKLKELSSICIQIFLNALIYSI